MAAESYDQRLLDAVLRKQMRLWASVAGALVVLSSIMMLALRDGESFRWTIVGLDLVWVSAFILAAARAPWLIVAAAVSVAELSLFGWAAVGTFILMVAAFAMRFRAPAAAAASVAMWCAAVAGIVRLGDGHPPGYEMRAFDLMFATCNTFVLGALMRTAITSRTRAESLAAQLQAAHEMLRRDLGTTEALAAAQERTRIAHELHDNLGHSLASAHVHAQLVRRLVGDADPVLLAAIEQVGQSTRQAMHDLRDAVALLRQRPGVGSLEQRVRALLERLPDAVLGHEVTVHGHERALPPAKEFALYRALQEAMTNVVKHARARSVLVRLEYAATVVSLEVQDDGVGAAQWVHGFGLRGIAERLETVGGRLSVSSTPGHGFRLRVEVDSR
ncbi:MAG: sensor histidine kinase [Deltaproteobacteria bacterium]|nr:sensor histidine kinase [Nannocystaceae bacterium]